MGVCKLTKWLVVSLAIAGAIWCADLPRKAPPFTLHMTDGSTIPVSTYQNKICAVAFISTTCPHCQKFVGVLNGIQKEYGPRGVQVLAAAFNEGANNLLPAFIQQFQPAFPIGWSDHVAVTGFMQISIMNPGFVPKIAFIDRTGTIQKQFEGTDPFFTDPDKSTRAVLDEMLKAPVPVAKRKTSAAAKQGAK